MPNEQPLPNIIDDLNVYSTDIACWRVEEIERRMRNAPETFPDFVKALADIESAKRDLIQKLGGDEFALEPLMRAYMAYHSELVFEVYKQAALDGGRSHHAYTLQELPRKEDAK